MNRLNSLVTTNSSEDRCGRTGLATAVLATLRRAYFLTIVACTLGCVTRPLRSTLSEVIRNDYYKLSSDDPVTKAAIRAVEDAGMKSELQDNRVRLCVYQTRQRYLVELIPTCPSPAGMSDGSGLGDTGEVMLPGEKVMVSTGRGAFMLSKRSLRCIRWISLGELEHTPRLFYGTDGDIRYCSLFGPLEDAGVINPPRF